jgi:hypothetical protein
MRKYSVFFLFLAVHGCRPRETSSLRQEIPPTPLFENNSVLQSTISGPLKNIFDEKEKFVVFDPDDGEWEQLYREGSIKLADRVVPIKIRARGRASRLGCAFPSLKFKLEDSDAAGTLLAGMRGFKTISHCDDNANVSAKYRREGAIYELVKFLFPISLKSRVLQTHYIDSAGGIDKVERSTVLEEVEDAAKRLGLEHVELDPSIYSTPWYAWDDAEAYSVLEASIGKKIIIQQYKKIRKENPRASKVELSALLRRYITERSEDLSSDIRVKAQAEFSSFVSQTQDLQREFLEKSDRSTALRLLFFNIMIGNSDWNYFGLNPIQTQYAMRNVQIFKGQDGTLFPSPYDFDLSRLVGGKIPTSQYFAKELTEYWSSKLVSLSKYFKDFDQNAEKDRLLSKRQAIENLIADLPLEAADKDIFSKTVSSFFDALQNFTIPASN